MLNQISKYRSKKLEPGFIKNLRNFNSSLNINNECLAKLDLENLLTVVTGQQVGIFINPALALYKAISAIKYAKFVEEKTNQACIPIFWLQTEDHDFDEIKSCSFLSKENNRITLELSSHNNKTPIGLLKIDREIHFLIAELEKHFADFRFSKEAIEILNCSYVEGYDYGYAFAKALSQILPNIIFLDPIKCEVSKYCKNAYKTCIDQFDNIANALKESESRQVALRENATLFFYRDSLERERLIRDNEITFKNKEKTFSKNELKTFLDTNPEKFSASALLRPLIQDSLLPTIAYIGGSAEISYLKQSEKLYPIFHQNPPLFIKRPSFSILDRKSHSWLNELNLVTKELNLNDNDLAKLIANKSLSENASPEFLLNNAIEKINETFNNLEIAITRVDQTLMTPAKKAREKSIESIKLLLDKYTKAAAQKEQIITDRINRIRTQLFPDGIAQERAISGIYLYAKYGPELIELLFNSIDPLNFSQEMEIVI